MRVWLRADEAEAARTEIHGGALDACGCCGRPKPENGNHDRDHGHREDEASFGKIRGVCCFRCNNVVLRGLTVNELRQALAYLERSETHYARSQ